MGSIEPHYFSVGVLIEIQVSDRHSVPTRTGFNDLFVGFDAPNLLSITTDDAMASG